MCSMRFGATIGFMRSAVSPMPRAPAIKQKIRDAFYVETPEWKKSVWDHANHTVTAALAALI